MSLQSNWSQASVKSDALYLQQSGDQRQVEPSDIAQGQIGDCFFLAALGEIALKDPAFITNELISSDGNGQYSVNLFNDGNGNAIPAVDSNGDNFYGIYGNNFFDGSLAPHNFDPVSVLVNDSQFSPDGVNNYNTSDIINGVKEIWPQVIEQAYLSNLAAPIDVGGNSENAFEALTGQTAYWSDTDELSAHSLANLNKNGALITFSSDSSTSSLPYNLISDHEYMFEGMEISNHHAFVDLINPWGSTQPDKIPFSQLASVLPNFVVGKI